MSAAGILKMIEEVAPDDTDKLHEIDARVWCWIEGIDPDQIFQGATKDYPAWKEPVALAARYTRSRDALKAIRPEGYRTWAVPYAKDFWQGHAYKREGTSVVTRELSTEELAELHAIIQAIEYERAKKP